MAQLEADALKDLQKHNMLKEVESDALVVTLDNELQALVKVSTGLVNCEVVGVEGEGQGHELWGLCVCVCVSENKR